MNTAISFGVGGLALLAGYVAYQWTVKKAAYLPPYLKWGTLSGIAALSGCSCYRLLQCPLQDLALVKLVIAGVILGAAAITDGMTHRIPNPLVLSGLVGRLLFLVPDRLADRDMFLVETFAAGLAFFVFLLSGLLLAILTKRGIGMGDVKLLAVLAAWLGLEGTFYSLMFGMFFCMLAAVFMLLLRKMTLKDSLPFGPFLYLGYITAMLLYLF